MSPLLAKSLRKKTIAGSGEEALQFISFKVGEETVATDILKNHEITTFRDLTRVPSLPPFIKGVLDLKGIAVPVLDLREKFGLPAVPYTKFSVVMVVDVAGRIMGIIVDGVADVLTVNKSEILPAPKFSTTIKAEFIKGMIKRVEGKFTIILDMDRLLSEREIEMVESTI